MAILADLRKNHRHTGILADGSLFFCRQFGIFQHLIKNLAAQGRFLLLLSFAEGFQHILRQAAVGRDTGFFYFFGYQFRRNFTHDSKRPFLPTNSAFM